MSYKMENVLFILVNRKIKKITRLQILYILHVCALNLNNFKLNIKNRCCKIKIDYVNYNRAKKNYASRSGAAESRDGVGESGRARSGGKRAHGLGDGGSTISRLRGASAERGECSGTS